MNRRTALGFGFLAPALLVVILFFLAPVVLTVFFAFTNMSTSTGIRGGEYLLNQSILRSIPEDAISTETRNALENAGYQVNDQGLAKLAETVSPATADELPKTFVASSLTPPVADPSALKTWGRIRAPRPGVCSSQVRANPPPSSAVTSGNVFVAVFSTSAVVRALSDPGPLRFKMRAVPPGAATPACS